MGSREEAEIDQRFEEIAACLKHLRDLKKDRERPPPDVRVGPGFPRRISPETGSYCTSPAQLCSELDPNG